MNETIGSKAGEIWNYLNEKEEATIAGLKKDLGLKGDQAGMAIGWLAREGQVGFEKKGNTVKVKLVK